MKLFCTCIMIQYIVPFFLQYDILSNDALINCIIWYNISQHMIHTYKYIEPWNRTWHIPHSSNYLIYPYTLNKMQRKNKNHCTRRKFKINVSLKFRHIYFQQILEHCRTFSSIVLLYYRPCTNHALF